MKHLLTIEQLTNQKIMDLINLAKDYKQNKEINKQNNNIKVKKQTLAANLFYESSTRTHKSFEVAQTKLGIDTINLNVQASSVNKGETLYDTVLTMQALDIDVAIIRHPQIEYYKELVDSKSNTIHIINGGDDSGEHPTQSLLDLMTIYEEFDKFKDLKIAIIGDLKHSRVARSNMKILKRLGAQIYFVGPSEWVTEEFQEYGKHINLDEMINQLDVLMCLRVQKERHEYGTLNLENFLQTYGLSNERYSKLKPSAITMHPLPANCGIEIDEGMIEAKKSRMVHQMHNGVFMRMAILKTILKDKF